MEGPLRSPAPRAGIHLVVVDDNPGFPLLLEYGLADLGVRSEVVAVASHDQAVAWFARNRPQPGTVILIDQRLGAVRGSDLARRVKADDVWCPVPVVLVVTFLAASDRDAVADLAVPVRAKPSSYGELMAMCRWLQTLAAGPAAGASAGG